MTPTNFHAEPASVNWRDVIRDHLDGLPPCQTHTPQQDLALLELALRGLHVGGFTDQKRLQDLLRGARDEHYHGALNGQRALLDELRARANSGMSRDRRGDGSP